MNPVPSSYNNSVSSQCGKQTTQKVAREGKTEKHLRTHDVTNGWYVAPLLTVAATARYVDKK
jgi:hypothetical protein